ncbi:SCO family protein [Zunongwangia sp. F363]|uniref:SCO family protein n=1 Tax=Autumnicola tepida TaxID=3075595 RepID=A0ABU3C876_9FLAO|nr:SCO family protein [Zunongwangia sp. F363]MDT0642524.1 SCO family protein [Zunongwangia sp. F363]
MKLKFTIIIILILAGLYSSCENSGKKLPILGNKEISSNEKDTLYQTIPDFSFINQDSLLITSNTFANKIYIADFFFTSCTTICPIMKNEMQKVYNKYKGNPKVAFLSHSIDPSHDSVPVLKAYAKNLEINNDQWHFVTGDQEAIFEMAQKHYMVSALEDSTVPDGVLHSGAFILIDEQKRIRGYYDGTNPEEVDKLIQDIPLLLHDKEL